MKASYLLSFIALFGIYNAKAQSVFTLADAFRYADKNSYLLETSQLEIEKARKQIQEITAIGLPQISAGADYNYSPQIPQQPVPAIFFDPNAPEGEFITVGFGVAHSSTASLKLNQLIFDGTYLLARQGSILFKEIKQDELTKSRAEVRDAVAKSYFNVQLAVEAQKVLEDNIESLSKNLKDVKALYESGFVEEQDAEQLEYLVNGLKLDVDNAKRNKILAEKVFKFTIGMPLDSGVILSQSLEDLYFQNVTGQSITAQAFDLTKHIEYQIVENQEVGASLQLKRTQWAYAPTINGFVTHSQSNYNDENFNLVDFNSYWIPATIMGFSVNLPLFTSMARPARVAQARIDLQEVQIAKEQVGESLLLEYEQAKSDYIYALERVQNENRNKEITKRIRDKTLIKFSEGISSSLDVTQAQNQYLNTESNFLSAALGLLNAKSRLDKVLGNYNTL
jgi:outer membrane protein